MVRNGDFPGAESKLMFGVVKRSARKPFRDCGIRVTLENSLRGPVKSDVEEFGDRAPKALQISHRPVVERLMIFEIQRSFLSQPSLESRQVAIPDLVEMRPPEWFCGERNGIHRWF